MIKLMWGAMTGYNKEFVTLPVSEGNVHLLSFSVILCVESSVDK